MKSLFGRKKKSEPSLSSSSSLSSSPAATAAPSAAVAIPSPGLSAANAAAAPKKFLEGTVYAESLEMLTGSLLIYIFAEVRTMARAGELEGGVTMTDLEPPMTTGKVLKVIQVNRNVLAKRAINHEDLETRLQGLKRITEHEPSFFSAMVGSSQTSAAAKSAQLVSFVDPSEDEMVHAIVVNDVKERVTVVFRGSVTKTDFIIDAKSHHVKVDNPVEQLDSEMSSTVEIHAGFHEYLFMRKGNDGRARLESILDDVKNILRTKRGYRVYCCGHSLGGALSTLCGFFAAADDEIIQLCGSHQPVRVVSVASPLVGSTKFRAAFQTLERRKRLQHLRIANKEDLVTLLPFVDPTVLSPALSLMKRSGNLYKHCGVRLQLQGGKMIQEGEEQQQTANTIPVSCNFTYPKDQGDGDAYAEELQRAVAAGKSLMASFGLLVKQDFDKVKEYHSCEEYEARLESCKEQLQKLTLDGLYSDKSITGNLLNADYKPDVSLSMASRVSRAAVLMMGSSSSTKKTSDDAKK